MNAAAFILWSVNASVFSTVLTLGMGASAAELRVEGGTLPVRRLAGWGVRFIPAELGAWVQDGGGSRR
jgi:hypothetical protein